MTSWGENLPPLERSYYEDPCALYVQQPPLDDWRDLDERGSVEAWLEDTPRDVLQAAFTEAQEELNGLTFCPNDDVHGWPEALVWTPQGKSCPACQLMLA